MTNKLYNFNNQSNNNGNNNAPYLKASSHFKTVVLKQENITRVITPKGAYEQRSKAEIGLMESSKNISASKSAATNGSLNKTSNNNPYYNNQASNNQQSSSSYAAGDFFNSKSYQPLGNQEWGNSEWGNQPWSSQDFANTSSKNPASEIITQPSDNNDFSNLIDITPKAKTITDGSQTDSAKSELKPIAAIQYQNKTANSVTEPLRLEHKNLIYNDDIADENNQFYNKADSFIVENHNSYNQPQNKLVRFFEGSLTKFDEFTNQFKFQNEDNIINKFSKKISDTFYELANINQFAALQSSHDIDQDDFWKK